MTLPTSKALFSALRIITIALINAGSLFFFIIKYQLSVRDSVTSHIIYFVILGHAWQARGILSVTYDVILGCPL